MDTTLFSFLTARSLLRVSRLSRRAHVAVKVYMQEVFNVNTLLARFFHNPPSFRSLQARTGTLIAGSVALQFFDRALYPYADLDLYVHPRHRREVGNWLISAGYTYCAGRNQDPVFEKAVARNPQSAYLQCSLPGVAQVLTFRKPLEDRLMEVQLVVPRRNPVEVILSAHSSKSSNHPPHPVETRTLMTYSACVMNIISYEKAYCLFPSATLEQRLSLLSQSSRGRSEARSESVEKYAERGYRILTFLPLADLVPPRKRPTFALGPRWLGDSDTWVIPLDTQDILPPPPANPYSIARTNDPAALSSFVARYDLIEGLVVEFSIVESPVLKYSYLFGDNDIVDYLFRILGPRTWDEQYKVLVCSLEDWQ